MDNEILQMVLGFFIGCGIMFGAWLLGGLEDDWPCHEEGEHWPWLEGEEK